MQRNRIHPVNENFWIIWLANWFDINKRFDSSICRIKIGIIRMRVEMNHWDFRFSRFGIHYIRLYRLPWDIFYNASSVSNLNRLWLIRYWNWTIVEFPSHLVMKSISLRNILSLLMKIKIKWAWVRSKSEDFEFLNLMPDCSNYPWLSSFITNLRWFNSIKSVQCSSEMFKIGSEHCKTNWT